MTINKNAEGEKLTVSLVGRLDTTTAPDLETELKSALDGIKELVFDLSSVEYISSAGLRVLLSAHKSMNSAGGSMIIKGANEEIMEIFDVTGFIDILNIES